MSILQRDYSISSFSSAAACTRRRFALHSIFSYTVKRTRIRLIFFFFSVFSVFIRLTGGAPSLRRRRLISHAYRRVHVIIYWAAHTRTLLCDTHDDTRAPAETGRNVYTCIHRVTHIKTRCTDHNHYYGRVL